ncbi:hypothetical protein B566_EDAN015944, partial [Ephemera danica]
MSAAYTCRTLLKQSTEDHRLKIPYGVLMRERLVLEGSRNGSCYLYTPPLSVKVGGAFISWMVPPLSIFAANFSCLECNVEGGKSRRSRQQMRANVVDARAGPGTKSLSKFKSLKSKKKPKLRADLVMKSPRSEDQETATVSSSAPAKRRKHIYRKQTPTSTVSLLLQTPGRLREASPGALSDDIPDCPIEIPIGKKYEDDFIECFQLEERRAGEICNACVLL